MEDSSDTTFTLSEKSSMTVNDNNNNTLTIRIHSNDKTVDLAQADPNNMFPNLNLPRDDGPGDGPGDGDGDGGKKSILFVDRLFGELTTKERAQVMLYKQIYDVAA